MRPKFKHLKPRVDPQTLAALSGPAIKTFLMCRPAFYGINYQINQWMSLGNQADKSLANEQWNTLYDRIVECGGEIRLVKDQPGLPDMVFTANAGLVNKSERSVIISNFKHPERKGEEEWFVQWFAEEGWAINYPETSFEGAGDALVLADRLVCGFGFRTDESSYNDPSFAGLFGDRLTKVRLVDPRFYHLDTCFCPLDPVEGGQFYMVYPGAFDRAGIEAIRAIGAKEIEVPEEEAAKFACNAVSIGDYVILPEGCPLTMKLLEEAGFTSMPVNVSEYIKAGGACKCLTLEIA